MLLGNLFRMATAGNFFASAAVMNRFLSIIAKVVVFSIICAFLVCGILANLFLMSYVLLVAGGLNPFLAVMVLASIAILIIALLILIIFDNIRHLRNWLYYRNSPRIRGAAAAFVEGFFSGKKKPFGK